jgi:hypothetical protein
MASLVFKCVRVFFTSCELGVVRAGLNSIWFVLYDHENWLVYDFRDEKIYLWFHDYLVFFGYFMAPPVHRHYLQFLLVNFHSNDDLSKRSVISHDYKTMHFYFSMLLSNFLLKLGCCAPENPRENKKRNMKLLQLYKKITF